MSDTENKPLDEAIDPPDNQGGGGDLVLDSNSTTDAKTIDPPDNQGGGGTT